MIGNPSHAKPISDRIENAPQSSAGELSMRWSEGQQLKTVEKAPITREQLEMYAEASGDRNAVHLDEDFAKSVGFPSVIVHGMLSMGFLADFVERQIDTTGLSVRRLQTRFRKVTYPGDVLRCEGRVKQSLGDDRWLLVFSSVNQRGETTADGEAEVGP